MCVRRGGGLSPLLFLYYWPELLPVSSLVFLQCIGEELSTHSTSQLRQGSCSAPPRVYPFLKGHIRLSLTKTSSTEPLSLPRMPCPNCSVLEQQSPYSFLLSELGQPGFHHFSLVMIHQSCLWSISVLRCCSVSKLYLTLCDTLDCSMSGFSGYAQYVQGQPLYFLLFPQSLRSFGKPALSFVEGCFLSRSQVSLFNLL